jgi:ribosomal protein L36
MKTTKICDDCKIILREASAYYTVNTNPIRRLCNKCMAKYLDIEEL